MLGHSPTSPVQMSTLPIGRGTEPWVEPPPSLTRALHRLRDRLAPADALLVGAQLPYRMRGPYFQGWSADTHLSGDEWTYVTAGGPDTQEDVIRDLVACGSART